MRRFIPILMALSLLSCAKPAAKPSGQPAVSTEAPKGLGPALETAKQQNRIVIIDFYTEWCGWCTKMDKDTYADPSVAKVLAKDFLLIKLNPEKDGSQQYLGREWTCKELMENFGARGYPASVFLTGDGKPVRFSYTNQGMAVQNTCIPGYLPPAQYLRLLDRVLTDPRQPLPIDDL